MQDSRPIFDPETRYRIEVQGRVELHWLQNFDSSAEIDMDESGQIEGNTIFTVRTDQSGIVGLVRRLHGLGVTILVVEIAP